MKMTYGYDVQEDGDPMLTFIQNTMSKYSRFIVPGTFLVDSFPLLRYVPSWVPGAGFHAFAKIWRAELLETMDRPHNFAKEQMVS